MVYSSDDLTLSDLPNGDHSIVFSLVDESHQALDPAVTATRCSKCNNKYGFKLQLYTRENLITMEISIGDYVLTWKYTTR